MPIAHYENFPVASLLLPAHLREAVQAIYVFARNADDFADEGALAAEERLARLDRYRRELDTLAAGQASDDPVFQRLRPVIDRHRLPLDLFHDLLDAFCQDVRQTRYADFAELRDYCRRSADPVGRLLLQLFGIEDAKSQRLSDGVCTSLQLINHWQDIAIDWRKGRVYLPQDDLARFGISEARIGEGRWDEAWAALMDFQIERARALMLEGRPLVRRLPGRIGWEIRFIVASGLRTLDKLQKIRGDVFQRRPMIRARDWPAILLRAAWS